MPERAVSTNVAAVTLAGLMLAVPLAALEAAAAPVVADAVHNASERIAYALPAMDSLGDLWSYRFGR